MRQQAWVDHYIRPHVSDEDIVLEPYASGDYVASVSGLPAGRWDARFQVFDQTGEDIVFRASKRIVILP